MQQSLALAGGLSATLAILAPSAANSTSTESVRGPAASAALTSARSVVGTVVRFSVGGVNVDVTIKSNHPTSREFLSMLPLRLKLQDLAGKEKISYLPRKLKTKGSPGSDPQNGDLIYYAPWGNLGFYYDASGIGFSRDTVTLGTYRASAKRLARLQRGSVAVRVLRSGPSS